MKFEVTTDMGRSIRRTMMVVLAIFPIGCGNSACGHGVFSDARQDALGIAAESNDVEAIINLVRSGADPNATGRSGITALICAQAAHNLDAFGTLLGLGADPAIEMESGLSPLLAAAIIDDPNYLRLAIEHGADPNTVTRESGETLLFRTLLPGGLPKGRILVAAGADVNVRTSLGTSPILLATQLSLFDIALFLLESGADPAPKDRWGNNVASSVVSRVPIEGTAEWQSRQLLLEALRKRGDL